MPGAIVVLVLRLCRRLHLVLRLCKYTKQGRQAHWWKGVYGVELLQASTQAKVNYKQKATMRRNVEMQLIVREKFFVCCNSSRTGIRLGTGNGHKDAQRESGREWAQGVQQQREKTLHGFRLTWVIIAKWAANRRAARRCNRPARRDVAADNAFCALPGKTNTRLCELHFYSSANLSG